MTDDIRQIKREITQGNRKPVLRFTLEPGEPELCESKIGGTPYLPHDTAWPLGTNGLPMTFLAQVDCAALAGLPDFPHSGLLQFFIGLDEVFGADYEDITKPGNFQVLYHEAIDPSVTADEVRKKRPEVPDPVEAACMTPLETACRIHFGTPEMQALTEGDFRYEQLFCRKWNALHPEPPVTYMWELSGVYGDGGEEEEEPHHQMGGYPFFTQSDPRSEDKYPELDTLLFQLDSEFRGGHDLVLWGDCGVGNFFISHEDLKKRDFSKVGYSWDCC